MYELSSILGIQTETGWDARDIGIKQHSIFVKAKHRNLCAQKKQNERVIKNKSEPKFEVGDSQGLCEVKMEAILQDSGTNRVSDIQDLGSTEK